MDGNSFKDLDEMIDKELIIKILTSKNKRVKTTLSVDSSVKKKLDDFAKQSKFNTSDIFNMILYIFFEKEIE
jgi:hypothetical protein